MSHALRFALEQRNKKRLQTATKGPKIGRLVSMDMLQSQSASSDGSVSQAFQRQQEILQASGWAGGQGEEVKPITRARVVSTPSFGGVEEPIPFDTGDCVEDMKEKKSHAEVDIAQDKNDVESPSVSKERFERAHVHVVSRFEAMEHRRRSAVSFAATDIPIDDP